MMLKRVFTVILVVCFLSFATAPKVTLAASGSDDETSADGKMIAAGLLLIAALFWIDSNNRASLEKEDKYANNKTKAIPQTSKDKEQGMKVGLDFSNSGYIPDTHEEPLARSEDEWRSPELKLGFRW